MRCSALAGGVGGAKLADGLAGSLPPEALTVVVNSGDDFEHLGLYVCPDLDTVCYTLGGKANPETGWGRADETGEGDGEGANLNLPLPRGTRWSDYERALDRALHWIGEFNPELLIVSFGADTWLPLDALAPGNNRLEFTLGPAPNESWATRRADQPPSFAAPAL